MKRWSLTLVFGLLGVIYAAVVPFVGEMVWPGSGMAHHGEDEANRQVKVHLLLGGGLFGLIWAWIGYVLAHDVSRGLRMALGVLVGTALTWVVGRMAVPLVDDFSFVHLAVAVLVWAVVCVAIARLMGSTELRPKSR